MTERTPRMWPRTNPTTWQNYSRRNARTCGRWPTRTTRVVGVRSGQRIA